MTINAHRKARAMVKLVNGLQLKEDFFVDNREEGSGDEDNDGEDIDVSEEMDGDAGPSSMVSFVLFDFWSFDFVEKDSEYSV